MKKQIFLVLFLCSTLVLANEESERGKRRGPPPGGEQCRQEMEALGCGHPREVGFEEFKTCIDSKKDQLSETCQQHLNNRPPKREREE